MNSTTLQQSKEHCQWLLSHPATDANFLSRLKELIDVEATLSVEELQFDFDQSIEDSLAHLLFRLCEKVRNPDYDHPTVSTSRQLTKLCNFLCRRTLGRYRNKLTLTPKTEAKISSEKFDEQQALCIKHARRVLLAVKYCDRFRAQRRDCAHKVCSLALKVLAFDISQPYQDDVKHSPPGQSLPELILDVANEYLSHDPAAHEEVKSKVAECLNLHGIQHPMPKNLRVCRYIGGGPLTAKLGKLRASNATHAQVSKSTV